MGIHLESDKHLQTIHRLICASAILIILNLGSVYFLVSNSTNQDINFYKQFIELTKNVLPNLISSLLAFIFVFLIYKKVEIDDRQQLATMINAALPCSNKITLYHGDVNSISPAIEEIVENGNHNINLCFFAYTGLTFTKSLLSKIINKYSTEKKISISMYIIDFNRQNKSRYPAHWPAEAEETRRQLGELCKRNGIPLEMYAYNSFPYMIGVNINNCDLFITTPETNGDSKVTNIAQEYYHFRSNQDNAPIFKTFKNMINFTQKNRIQL